MARKQNNKQLDVNKLQTNTLLQTDTTNNSKNVISPCSTDTYTGTSVDSL